MEVRRQSIRQLQRDWYTKIRPDLTKPPLLDLWDAAITIRNEVTDKHHLESGDLLHLFVSWVEYSLTEFDKTKVSGSIPEEERVFRWVMRKVRWGIEEYLLQQRRKRRSERRVYRRLLDALRSRKPGISEAVRHAVHRAVRQLPERERRLIERHFYDDASHKQLSVELGYSSRHRARCALEAAKSRLRPIIQREVDKLGCDDFEFFGKIVRANAG